MQDTEARGLILRCLYDLRHKIRFVNQSDFNIKKIAVEKQIVPNILEQLAQKNLIEWNPQQGVRGSYLMYDARITADGVDVIEGTKPPPIDITFPITIGDNSTNIQGVSNFQIGKGNIQGERINQVTQAIDHSRVSQNEKASLLDQIIQIGKNVWHWATSKRSQ